MLKRLQQVLDGEVTQEIITRRMERADIALKTAKLNAEDEVSSIEEEMLGELNDFDDPTASIERLAELLQKRDQAQMKKAIINRLRDYLNGGDGYEETDCAEHEN